MRFYLYEISIVKFMETQSGLGGWLPGACVKGVESYCCFNRDRVPIRGDEQFGNSGDGCTTFV